MKKFLFLFFCLGSLQVLAQNMVVVNNTPGVTANYKTLQGAVDSVTDGTIILLQPGPTSYGDVTIKKRVSIIGAGYFLNHNPDPASQATQQSSVVTRIFFDTASNGSYITGLSITAPINSGTNYRLNFNFTSNVTISRCLILNWGGYVYATRSSSITVKQCYFNGGGNNATIAFTSVATGIEFLNNIFSIDQANSHILPTESFTNYTASFLFKNNVMFNVSNPGYYPSLVTLTNNVIFQTNGSGTINCAAAMNNAGDATYSSGGPNITNAVLANTLVLNSDPTITSADGRYKLKPGSVAIGYGQGGVDCGAFGGSASEKYELSGIAEFVPNIFYLNVPVVGGSTGGLPVHIKVRANQ